MQIFLHVEKGPHIGRRVAIRSGQIASIGKTEQSDHCFEQDIEMADQHFRIRVNDTCTIEAVDSDTEFLVNGELPENPTLSNGDTISAGLSVFRVEVEGAMNIDALPDEGPTESDSGLDIQSVDLTQLCVDLELGDEATEKTPNHTTAEDFLNELVAEKLFNDAIRVHVHLLSPTDAIHWAVASIQSLANDFMTPSDSEAIQKASDWADDPSVANRRKCGQIAEELEYEGVGATLALAAFLSGGNIAPEDLEEEVQPEPLSFGQATTGAVLLASAKIDPDDSEKILGSILKS